MPRLAQDKDPHPKATARAKAQKSGSSTRPKPVQLWVCCPFCSHPLISFFVVLGEKLTVAQPPAMRYSRSDCMVVGGPPSQSRGSPGPKFAASPVTELRKSMYGGRAFRDPSPDRVCSNCSLVSGHQGSLPGPIIRERFCFRHY